MRNPFIVLGVIVVAGALLGILNYEAWLWTYRRFWYKDWRHRTNVMVSWAFAFGLLASLIGGLVLAGIGNESVHWLHKDQSYAILHYPGLADYSHTENNGSVVIYDNGAPEGGVISGIDDLPSRSVYDATSTPYVTIRTFRFEGKVPWYAFNPTPDVAEYTFHWLPK